MTQGWHRIAVGAVVTSVIVLSPWRAAAEEAKVLASGAGAPLSRQAMSTVMSQVAVKAMAIPTPPAGSWGVVSAGTGGGGRFRDADGGAEAWLGTSGFGIESFGSLAGGYFADAASLSEVTIGTGDVGVEAVGATAGGWFGNTTDDGGAHVGYGSLGIDARGPSAGGYFKDTNSSGQAYVGYGDVGIEGRGNTAGGYFLDPDNTGYAYVGYGNTGIDARGSAYGGYFKDTNSSGYATVGYGDLGIDARGNTAGGYFKDFDNSGYAYLGYRDTGIDARGNTAGGYFKDADSTGYAHAGFGDTGIEAGGSARGGYFWDDDSSGIAYVGYGDYGIDARGDTAGGYFKDSDGTGEGWVGYGNRGIEAAGSEAGGYFEDSNSSGFAWVAWSDLGIDARGNTAGGYFADADGSGYAYVGYGAYGIDARGASSGGYFKGTSGDAEASVGGWDFIWGPGVDEHLYYDIGIRAVGTYGGGAFADMTSGTYGEVAIATESFNGNGSKNFVQNHPEDADAVIVYAAVEGDEVGTYTRGSARLVAGEARVALGETFKWVTNPDLGLTAYVTPVGGWCDLYVAEKGTEHIVVRSRDGGDCTFDYIVYGLRIGFEEAAVVQEKRVEAYIPAMTSHRELVARRPELARYRALERFEAARREVGGDEPLDTSRAAALKAAIHEFDPALDRAKPPRPPRETMRPQHATAGTRAQGGSAGSTAGVPSTGAPRGTLPVVAGGGARGDDDVYARSFRPAAGDLASLVAVAEDVEPGDVLVIDREHAGAMTRSQLAEDRAVAGVVAGEPGLVLGSSPDAPDGPRRVAVAFSGVALCKVDASYGAVQPGDLLVSSPTAGHAMRSDAPLPGTVIGKALEPLGTGLGLVQILVTLR